MIEGERKYADDLLPEAREGWSWPLRLELAHYFHRGVAICEGAELIEHGGEPDRIDRRPRNRCRRCETRLDALRRWRRGEGRGVRDAG